MPWKYDPGNRRFKHKWKNDQAGFQVEGGLLVGKCPSTIKTELAEQLLNSGIAWDHPNLPSPSPRNIYNVHEGVIYKASVTDKGVSYHDYPVDGPVPKEVIKRLRERAIEKKCEPEFDRWLKQHIR